MVSGVEDNVDANLFVGDIIMNIDGVEAKRMTLDMMQTSVRDSRFPSSFQKKNTHTRKQTCSFKINTFPIFYRIFHELQNSQMLEQTREFESLAHIGSKDR